jgi:hypothetical protein
LLHRKSTDVYIDINYKKVHTSLDAALQHRPERTAYGFAREDHP